MPLRRRRRLGLRTATTLAALVLATSAIGHTVVTSAAGRVHRVDAFHGLDDRPEAGRGVNILLIGTDSREGLTEAERRRFRLGGAGCFCADSIMLLHLSEDRDRASVVSLPRDSYAALPAHDLILSKGHHEAHPDKLNAALSHGGPSLMVRAVEDLTRLRIDHYLEVSFVSFMRAVDEIGGVRVCTTRPLKDDHSGLDLPAGTHTLDGAGALAFVRARHVDGSSDFGRMARQQRFLAAFLDQAVSGGVLLNPAKFGATADALLGSVSADPGLGAEEMLELAGLMRDFDPDAAEFASVPVEEKGRAVPGVGSTVVWDRAGADRFFSALRADRPLPGAAGAAAGEQAAAGQKNAPDAGTCA
ncbi:LCP family protein [Streptomyces hoynatensis]|uniref:LytR family transcriptional regulator n=1 Tax=Streptomyces hoynatensis TaxID=1141874 RepID=A0A3A9YMU6_9ACTN|nr:LCP family protein [Streptomyces hoynatensis]RKN37409.1 LytR family transcriptional regulator [Streptomyces hoynatensis]